MLRGVGAPPELPHLSDLALEWAGNGPHGRPVYRSADGNVEVRWWRHAWSVCDPSHPDVLLYARAVSEAAHPNTVWPGEWRALVARWPDVWETLPQFRLTVSYRTSRASPLPLSHAGEDLFERWQLPRPVWYVWKGEVHYSGAKGSGDVAGRRYCARCDRLVSANNYVSQHCRNKHPTSLAARALPRDAYDGDY